MRRKGYYRWLLAYLPVFFIIISALIIIFFFAMSNYSKRQTVLANQVFAEHVLQTIDSSLRYTEKMIIKELLMDEKRFSPASSSDSNKISKSNIKLNLV